MDMSNGISVKEEIDQRYNRIKHLIDIDSSKAIGDAEIRELWKKVVDASKEFSKSAEQVEAALNEIEGILGRKNLLIPEFSK